MAQNTRFDLVYLNTRGSNMFNDWVYYRTGSDGGNRFDPITICRVEWPSFSDIDLIWDERKAVITSPGLTRPNFSSRANVGVDAKSVEHRS